MNNPQYPNQYISSQGANTILEEEFLEIRAKLIEIAAAFDRIECGKNPHKARSNPKYKQLKAAIGLLVELDGIERTKMIQDHFSLD